MEYFMEIIFLLCGLGSFVSLIILASIKKDIKEAQEACRKPLRDYD